MLQSNAGNYLSRTILWKGAAIRTIADAWLHSVESGEPSPITWDGSTYAVDDGAGNRWAITFESSITVAAIFDHESPRNPYMKSSTSTKRYLDYFAGAESDVIQMAEQHALRYLLDKMDSKILPIITAAFWTAKEQLTAAESWSEIWHNGGRLLEIELEENTQVRNELIMDNYEFSEEEVETINAIYQQNFVQQKPILKGGLVGEFSNESIELIRSIHIPAWMHKHL